MALTAGQAVPWAGRTAERGGRPRPSETGPRDGGRSGGVRRGVSKSFHVDGLASGARSPAEGDNRSEAKRCGGIRADPATRRPEATLERAAVSSDRRAQTDVNKSVLETRVCG
jgi:hypothetical protein